MSRKYLIFLSAILLLTTACDDGDVEETSSPAQAETRSSAEAETAEPTAAAPAAGQETQALAHPTPGGEDFDLRAIQVWIRDNSEPIGQCFTDQFGETSDVAGQVMITITVTTEEVVTAVALDEVGSDVGECIAAHIGTMELDVMPGQEIALNVPFDFNTGSGQ